MNTVPGKKWFAGNDTKKLAILEALIKGKRRYMEIWNFVKERIGNKTTFQLYLAQLEDEGLIKRTKFSKKRVEFELLVSGEQIEEISKKISAVGLIENMKRLHGLSIGFLEDAEPFIRGDKGYYEWAEAVLIESFFWDGSLPHCLIGKGLDFSGIDEPDIIPCFVLQLGDEFKITRQLTDEELEFPMTDSLKKELKAKGITTYQIDEQFLCLTLPFLLKQLFLKFMNMRAEMQNIDPNEREKWLKAALDFEAVLSFKLSGRELLKKNGFEKIFKER
jgi:DNA-binding HxlR family transcriptional regulator